MLPAVLSEAEAVMWEYPDSALFILRSMPQPSSSDEETYATWSLLLAQARDKVYGKRLPDSLNVPSSEDLVQTALTYFERSGDLRRKAQAYFYRGQLLRDRNEYEEAVSFFLKAKDVMEDLDEPLFTCLVCQTLGNVYRYQDLHVESLVQLRDAYRYALKSNNEERVSYALSELGRTFTEMHRLDSALYYFEHSLLNAKEIGDMRLQAMAMGELGFVYGELGQHEMALKFAKEELDICMKTSSNYKLAQVYYGVGEVFRRLNELDSAKIYFMKSLKTDNLYTLKGACKNLYNISVEQKLYEEAVEYNKQYFIYSDSLRRINHTYELTDIQAKYDNEKLKHTNNHLRIRKSRQENIGLALIVFLLGIALVYQYRLLRKERQLTAIKGLVYSFEMRIRDNEKQIGENERLIVNLHNQQSKVDEIRSLNEVLQEENKKLQVEIDKYSLLWPSQKIHLSDQIPYFELLRSLKESPAYLEESDWRLITDWVNLQYNHFIVRLRHDFPDFTDLDSQYCCLIKMGFTTSQIATFMASSPNSVTKQKQRIKQRIKNSDFAPVDENFSLDEYLKNY